MAEDPTQLAEELCAIEAIYGDDCEVTHDERRVRVWVPARQATPHVQLRLLFPSEGYPSQHGPIIELEAPQLSDDVHAGMLQELDDLFLPGEVTTFNMVDLLRERLAQDERPDDAADDAEQEQAEPPVQRADTSGRSLPVGIAVDALADAMASKIVTGEPYTERKSTFQAHVAPVSSVEEVDAMMTALLRNNKIARATHNMLAYRTATAGTISLLQDFDDDGEAAAGSRLLHLLQMADVQGACVVVSRWFGGVHLGPSRFAIINNTARQLLVEQGYMPSGATRSRKK